MSFSLAMMLRTDLPLSLNVNSSLLSMTSLHRMPLFIGANSQGTCLYADLHVSLAYIETHSPDESLSYIQDPDEEKACKDGDLVLLISDLSACLENMPSQ